MAEVEFGLREEIRFAGEDLVPGVVRAEVEEAEGRVGEPFPVAALRLGRARPRFEEAAGPSVDRREALGVADLREPGWDTGTSTSLQLECVAMFFFQKKHPSFETLKSDDLSSKTQLKRVGTDRDLGLER